MRLPLQAVVLAHRPQISIPLTSISPALLEELTNEISTLASVYHKPVEAFIGRGRLGADELARKGQVAHGNGGISSFTDGDADDVEGARAAIKVVAQGQRSENLLDFGGDDDGEQNSLGVAVQTAPFQNKAAPPAASKSSTNPLDDLLGLFDSAGLGPGSAAAPAAAGQGAARGGHMNGMGLGTPNATASPAPHPSQQQTPVQSKQSDMDLMGDLF